MYKLKLTRLQNSIFRLLCIKAGEKLNQRTIAKLLDVTPTAVSKALKYLKEQNMIEMQKDPKMNLTLVELNRKNLFIISLKRTENLKMIYESGLNEFLSEQFPGATIILFGSYSTGEDTINSDIDIAVIESKEKTINLSKFEKLLERKIFLHYYKDFKEINKNLRTNIINGITLSGIVEI